MKKYTLEDKHKWQEIKGNKEKLECSDCGMEISFPSWEWDEEIDNVCRVAIRKTGNWKK